MNPWEYVCAVGGHLTLGPTGDEMTCVRCGKTLNGLGLDPDLDVRRHSP